MSDAELIGNIRELHTRSKAVFSVLQNGANEVNNAPGFMIPDNVEAAAQRLTRYDFPNAPANQNNVNGWLNTFEQMAAFQQQISPDAQLLAQFAKSVRRNDPALEQEGRALQQMAIQLSQAIEARGVGVAQDQEAREEQTQVSQQQAQQRARTQSQQAPSITPEELLLDNQKNSTIVGDYKLSIEEVAAALSAKGLVEKAKSGSFSEIEAINAVNGWLGQNPQNIAILQQAAGQHMQGFAHELDGPLQDIMEGKRPSPSLPGQILAVLDGIGGSNISVSNSNVESDEIRQQAALEWAAQNTAEGRGL